MPVQAQLVVTADTKVKAYDVNTGKVVWEVAGLGTNPDPATRAVPRHRARDERLPQSAV